MKQLKSLTQAQQELAEQYMEDARRYARKCIANGFGDTSDPNQFYNIGADPESAAYEALVNAAVGFNPEHPKANFRHYLATCLNRQMRTEHNNCERYMKGNYETETLKKVKKEGIIREKSGSDFEYVKTENEIAMEKVVEYIEGKCKLRIRAKDLFLTLMHERSLEETAKAYNVEIHIIRNDQKKMIKAIRENDEISKTLRECLKAKNGCGIISSMEFENVHLKRKENK